MNAADASAGPSDFRPPAPVPGTRDPAALTVLIQSIRRPIEGWPRAVFEEAAYRPPVPGLPVFVIDPAAIREVMLDQAETFPHGALWQRMMRPVWGEGLVTVEGAEWRWQRRAVAPAFRAAQMTALAPRMRAAAEAALARWADVPEGPVDMAEECARITFDVILDTLLSGGEDFDRASVRDRIAAFMAQLGRMRLSYFLAPDAYHAGRVTRASAEAELLRNDVERMICRRRLAPPRGDLIDLMLAARDPETGQPMDDAILRDNLLGFIVAGHETSAVALTWSLYLVSQHARTRERIRSEIAAVAGAGPIEGEHVDQLRFTRQVIQEAMRLYPPGHMLVRVAARDIEVAGMRIRKGSRVIVPVYAVHRHRSLWANPDRFDPDRFGRDAPAYDRFAYLPFGAGPRSCIGAGFAMTELVVLLATLARAADFAMEPGHRVWPIAGLALRPEGGLPMRISAAA